MMKPSALLVLVAACFWMLPTGSKGGYEDSRSWFEVIPETERLAIQADLTLLGHYRTFIDGKFGKGTYGAIVAFQREHEGPREGVLFPTQRALLRELAGAEASRLGLEPVRDLSIALQLHIPKQLTTKEIPSRYGTRFVSGDGSFEIETIAKPFIEESFSDFFATLTDPREGRTVTYSNYSHDRSSCPERRVAATSTASYYAVTVEAWVFRPHGLRT